MKRGLKGPDQDLVRASPGRTVEAILLLPKLALRSVFSDFIHHGGTKSYRSRPTRKPANAYARRPKACSEVKVTISLLADKSLLTFNAPNRSVDTTTLTNR